MNFNKIAVEVGLKVVVEEKEWKWQAMEGMDTHAAEWDC